MYLLVNESRVLAGVGYPSDHRITVSPVFPSVRFGRESASVNIVSTRNTYTYQPFPQMPIRFQEVHQSRRIFYNIYQHPFSYRLEVKDGASIRCGEASI